MAQWDGLLLGRRTYEEFAAVWPGRPVEQFGPVSEFMNDSPKFVVSTTLSTVEWKTSTLISGNVAEQLRALKRQLGKNIAILGTATLVNALLLQNLVDDLQLFIDPIIVGKGKRLFEEATDRLPLKLCGSRAFATGALFLVYEPAVG